MGVSRTIGELQRYWERPAFSAGGQRYHQLDVALAAMARGEWAAFERQLAEGLACAARATAEGQMPSDDEVDEAATAFRYERELLAASEMNDWLHRHGLSSDEWLQFLTRQVLRQRWHSQLADTVTRFACPRTQLAHVAVTDGVCSGSFDASADRFAERVALVLMTGDAAAGRPEHADDAERVIREYGWWLGAPVPDDIWRRLERVLAIERRFEEAVDELLAQASLADVVEQHRLHWLQVEIDTLRFTTEDAAREALLCLRVDGLSFHDVAALSRRTAERRVSFADELDSDQRDTLLGLEPGSVTGPLAVDECFELATLVRRTSPSLSDARVVERARQHVMEMAVRRAVNDHVTAW